MWFQLFLCLFLLLWILYWLSPLQVGNVVGRIKANVCHVLFTKGMFNRVGTLEYSSTIQKLSYLKEVSKTVKYRLHVLELNKQSNKKEKGFKRSMMTDILVQNWCCIWVVYKIWEFQNTYRINQWRIVKCVFLWIQILWEQTPMVLSERSMCMMEREICSSFEQLARAAGGLCLVFGNISSNSIPKVYLWPPPIFLLGLLEDWHAS